MNTQSFWLLLITLIATSAEETEENHDHESRSLTHLPLKFFKGFPGGSIIPNQPYIYQAPSEENYDDKGHLAIFNNNPYLSDFEDTEQNEKSTPRLFFKKLLLGKFFKHQPTIIKIPIPIPIFITEPEPEPGTDTDTDTDTDTITGTGTATAEETGDGDDDGINANENGDGRYDDAYYDYDYDLENDYIPPSGNERSLAQESPKSNRIQIDAHKKQKNTKSILPNYPEHYEHFLKDYQNFFRKQYNIILNRNKKNKQNPSNSKKRRNKHINNGHRFIKIKRTRNRRKPQQRLLRNHQ